MLKRISFFFILIICMLVSVSCSTDLDNPSEPTVTPSEEPWIIEPAKEATEEPTVVPEPTAVPLEVEPSPTEVAVRESIRVGAKKDTEQRLLGKMLVFALERAGFQVEDWTGDQGGDADTVALREALESGEMDLQWESTGAALSLIHDFYMPDLDNNPDSFLRTVRSLDRAWGLQWLERLEYNSTQALVVSKDLASKEGINTLQELANFMNQKDSALKLCAKADFRDNELPALQEQYGFSFKDKDIHIVEGSQSYQSLRDGQCDVASGHTTDGYVTAWELQSLEDTRHIFPFYNPALVIREAILEQHEGVDDVLAELLATVTPRLNERRMSQLKACVELGADKEANSGDEMSVEEVARAFLDRLPLACLPRAIRVSSRRTNRSVWVGKGFVLILKDRGYDVIDKTAFGSRAVTREAILNGEIDLYCERTTQALMEFHNIDPQALPHEPEALYTLAKNLDEPLGLTWITHSKNMFFPTLVVKSTLYEEEGIQSIAELVDFMNSNDAPLNLCVEEGFYHAPDGILALEEHYGFKFKDEKIVWTDPQELDRYPNYEALRDGACDVTHGTSVDDIEAWGFRVLTDSKSFFPPSVPGIVVHQDLLEEYPELAETMVCVSDYLDTESVIRLNRATWGPDGQPDTGDEESMMSVALPFFCEQGLIKNSCSSIEATEEPSAEASEEANAEAGEEANAEASEEANAEATGAVCEELLLNGDFEDDGAWSFPATSGKVEYSTDVAHSADRSLLIGYSTNDEKSGQSVSKQLISIPGDAESATLSYWYYPISNDPQADDVQGALILSGDESIVVRRLQRDLSDERAWTLQEHDLSGFIGEEVVLYFYVDNNGDGRSSGMYLDEVSVQVCSGSE